VPSADDPGSEAGDGFRLLDERVVHRGHVITTTVATFAAPDGTSFERDVVRHPGAVAVVPLDDRGRVHLVRQYRPAVDAWILEVPAGTRDVEGEPPGETARRELAEEVGVAAERLDLLVRTVITPGFCDEVSWVFLARGLSAVPTDRRGPEEERMTVVPVPLDAFDDLLASGGVVDATTILGVELARRRLEAEEEERPSR
jgi:ADP-ribose pyrophosphatase